MPFEIVALTFVIVALTGIVARFMAQDEHGRADLSAVIDQSVGAYLVRRLIGRPTTPRRHHSRRPSQMTAKQPVVPAGPPLIHPTRLVVSSVRRPVATLQRAAGPNPPRKRPSALVLQRQAAAMLAAAVLVLIIVGAVLAPRAPQGAVLGATGTPGSAGSNAAPSSDLPSDTPEPPAASG